MSSAHEIQRLVFLRQRLDQALGAQDWHAVACIDADIRQSLLQLDGRPASEAMRRARQELKTLHVKALRACVGECERLRQMLQAHLHYAEGSAAYQQLNSWQERG